MADCCKIIRLLKEVKRKADTSFCEINQKISRLESKYNLLTKQHDELKTELELSKRKLAEINQPKQDFDQNPMDAARRGRSQMKRSGSRKRGHRSLSKKRKRLFPRKMRKMMKRGSARKSRKGKSKRRNPCL